MSQNNSNEKLPAMTVIETINEVQGFDPAPFAVEYTDLNSNETRKKASRYDSNGMVPLKVSGRKNCCSGHSI